MFPDYGFQSLLIASGNLAIPFSGLVRIWQEAASGKYSGGSAVAAWFYPALIIGALALAVVFLRKSRSVLNWILAAYAILAVTLSYMKFWIYMPNAERVTFEVFLFLIIAFAAGREAYPKWCGYAILVFIALTMFYDLFFLSVAPSFRAGFYGVFSA
jgi:hypothetical protein